MKRKTQATIKNSSTGVPNFALNGTRRSQGYVGQDMRGRTLPKTIMKGNVPKGHGGCCGFYPQGTIINSIVDLNTPNDPTIIKSSVLGTNGMLMTKYRWIRRPQPYSTTKPDWNAYQEARSQSMYISKLEKDTLDAANNSTCQRFQYIPTSCPRLFRTNPDSQISQVTEECKRITKDITNHTSTPKNGVAMSEGMYILQLDQACGVFDQLSYPRGSRAGGPACG